MENTRTLWTLAAAVLVLVNNGLTINASPVWQYERSGCYVRINGGLAEPQPLVLRPENNSGFAYPEQVSDGGLHLSRGEQLRLICLGSTTIFNVEDTVAESALVCASGTLSDTVVSCVDDTIFNFDDLDVKWPFEEIACNSYPAHTARRTGEQCPNGEVVEVGFDVPSGDFERLITICHDSVNHHSSVAHSKIPAVIDAAQTNFPRPGFVKGSFYSGVSMATIYTRANQRKTLARILNNETLALEYMPTTGQYFWSKGHLAPKADFIYGSHHRATFYYVNTVPKWQTVNGGNWATMEANVRKYAINMNVDLEIWTGSIGTLRLQDINGTEQEIYLYVDDNGNKAVPVPMLLFKVVYEPVSKKGIVFVTVNNPHQQKLTKELTICNDVCHRLGWVTWSQNDSVKGLSYCCEIDQLRNSFPGISSFETVGILL